MTRSAWATATREKDAKVINLKDDEDEAKKEGDKQITEEGEVLKKATEEAKENIAVDSK